MLSVEPAGVILTVSSSLFGAIVIEGILYQCLIKEEKN